MKKKILLTDKLTLIFAILLAVFAANAIYRLMYFTGNENMRSSVSLSYCSKELDSQCQKGVARIEYTVKSRHSREAELYGYPNSYRSQAKITELQIKFNSKTKDYLDGDYSLYHDSDGDGVYAAGDRLLTGGAMKKKTLLFEGVNFITDFHEGPDIVDRYQFFVVSEQGQVWTDISMENDDGEPEKVRAPGKIEVKSIDLSNNRAISGQASFVDLSLFGHREQRELSKEEFLDANAEFSDAPDNGLILRGSHTINRDVIIPPGLSVSAEPGLRLGLGPDVSVVSYSPINFNGTGSNPIVIKNAEEEPFGVVSILGQSRGFPAVEVRHLDISGGSEAEINGAYMSGMFNIYRSEMVTVVNSSFRDAQADDGLNIKNSKISVQNNYFEGNSADAFDGDFVTGPINNNLFVDNGNDSLDFSGSDLDIGFNNIINSGDKCISVGEATNARIQNNILDGCLIAVQVKDKSDASILNNVIINSRQAAVDAYIKKSFFGEPSLNFGDNIILDNEAVATGLAAAVASDDNTLDGDLNVIREEIPWVQQIYQKSPRR